MLLIFFFDVLNVRFCKLLYDAFVNVCYIIDLELYILQFVDKT